MNRFITTGVFTLVVSFSFSQINWQKNGNNAFPPGVPPILGTNGTWNAPLSFITNGIQRARLFTGPLGGLAINSLGNTQVTPGSLLSIGEDRTGYSGWRSWMYEGMSVQANSDNMYVGLKYEGASNRSDAIIAWGNDDNTSPPGTKDYLRFIFSGVLGGYPPVASQQNGLEVGRFSPEGNFGIGNFFNGGLGTFDPTQKLDVDGNARFRNVLAGGGNSLVLGIQQGTNPNDIILSRLAFLGNSSLVLASNGTWVPLPVVSPYFSQNGLVATPAGNVFEFGAPCSGATPSQNNMATLLASRRIIMGGESILFDTPNNTKGRVSIGDIGIGNCTPGNKLEIVADGSCPTPSGLRLTSLAGTTSGNGTGDVLSINANGDVVLVKDAGGVGNYCGQNQNPLTANYEVPLNNNNYAFTGWGPFGTSNVTIGLPCGMSGSAKLMVYQNTGFPGGPNVTTPSTTAGGSFWNAHVNTNFQTVNNVFYGLIGTATPPLNPNTSAINAHMRVGVWGLARHAKYSYGVRGHGHSHSNGNQVGGYFSIEPSAISANAFSAGVYSIAPAAGNSFAGYFNGILTTGNVIIPSDSTVKNNVLPINNAISRIMTLKPIEFEYDTMYGNSVGLYLPGKKHYGFNAQELANSFPENVMDLKKPAEIDPDGNEIFPEVNYKGINYINFIGFLTRGIQEQQMQIEKLQNMKSGDGIRIDTTSGTKTVSVSENLLLKEVIYESDANSKTNVQPLTSALSKVKKLNGVSFNWINTDSLTQGTQYGFIAQQVDTVLPDLIYTAPNGKKSLKYNGLLAWYAEAIQEQQNTIDSMKTMMNQMMQMMNACCSNTNTKINSNSIAIQDVELSDKNVVVLNQNVPNPFAEQTTITYNIPEQFNFAQILFYDMNGRMIKSVDIKQTGRGLLNVYANDLSNGIYSYTLVIDGQIIDTKKMVKQN